MKYCPGCGAPSQDNAKFCGYCGRKLIQEEKPVEVAPVEPAVEETPIPQDVDRNGKRNKIPHWTQRMFAIMGIWFAIITGVGGIAIGAVGLSLTNENCEYRRRYVVSVVIGGIMTALVVFYYLGLIISAFGW